MKTESHPETETRPTEGNEVNEENPMPTRRPLYSGLARGFPVTPLRSLLFNPPPNSVFTLAGPLLVAAAMLLPVAAHAQGAVQAWVQFYNGGFEDSASTLALDANGNVYVTGYSLNATSWDDGDYATLKYSSAGVPLWTNRYSGPRNYKDEPKAVAVGLNGNVYVTGVSAVANTPTGLDYDFLTIAYSSAGAPLWTNRYDGPYDEPWGQPSGDGALAIAVDTSGNVYVTGKSSDPQGRADWVTVKYSEGGVALWANRYSQPGSDNDEPFAMAVGHNGNVYVTGYSASGNDVELVTLAYSSTGVPLWTNRLAGAYGVAIALDNSDNVYVASDGALCASYSSAGVPRWTNRLDGRCADLAVAANGNVYLTGGSDDPFGTSDYSTWAYSSAGVPLWTNRYGGPAKYTDGATAVAVDANSNVYVTGSSYGGDATGYDYLTIAYSSAGAPLWTNRYKVGGASDVAVDASGNVYVTGSSLGISSDFDFATVKYAPFRPSLTISMVGTQARIAWPSSATGWALRRASLVAGPYTDPGLSVTTEANESVAYDTLGATAAFYRLEKQP